MEIRIWKLGNLKHRIMPTEKAIDNLVKAITDWDGNSDFDLVWGPELTLERHVCNSVDIITTEKSPIRLVARTLDPQSSNAGSTPA